MGHRIRVRHGNIRSQFQNLNLEEQQATQSRDKNLFYEADSNFITIHTRHFSGYIITLQDINCCAGSANILLFGSVANVPNDEPLATLKVYMSSVHSAQIRDYRTVSYIPLIIYSSNFL